MVIGRVYSIQLNPDKIFQKDKSLNRDLPKLIMTGNFPELYDNYLIKKYGESYKRF